MKRNRRAWRGPLAAVVAIILYFLIAAHPTGREIVLRPDWSTRLGGVTARPDAAGTAPFQLGDRFGYVTRDGGISLLRTAAFRVALSARGFVAFSRVGTTWLLEGPDGGMLASFSGDGYPLLDDSGERLFLVRTDLTALSELDIATGEERWSREFATLLTSVAISGGYVAAGLLDGSLLLIDASGATTFERAAEGSRVAIALGVAVTPDGTRVAAVTGIDPQIVTVHTRRGAGWTVTARTRLATDFRREVRVRLAPDGRWLVCEAQDGALLLASDGGAAQFVPLGGSMAGVAFAPSGKGLPMTCLLAARDRGSLELVVARPAAGVLYRGSGEPAGSWPDGAETTWLAAAGDRLLLGAGDRLTGLALEVR